LAADGGREGNFGRHPQQLLENGRFSRGGGFAIRVAGIIEAQSAAQPGWIFGQREYYNGFLAQRPFSSWSHPDSIRQC
jgi:hypothetical protein